MRFMSGLCMAVVATGPVAAQADTWQGKSVHYTCARGAQVEAVYLTDAQRSLAVVMVEGRMVAFETVVSASGAKYAAMAGAPQPYVWWTKGDQATLFATDDGDAILTDCIAHPE